MSNEYNGPKLVDIRRGAIKHVVRRLSNKLDLDKVKAVYFIIERIDGTFWAQSSCEDDYHIMSVLEKVKHHYGS